MIKKLLSKNLFKGLYKTSLCQNTLENCQANLTLFSTFKINIRNSSNLTNVGNIQMLFSTNSNSNSTANTGNQSNPQGIIGKSAGNNNNGASGDSTGNSNNGASGSGASGIEAPESSNNGTSSGNSNNGTSESSNNGRQSGNSKGSQNHHPKQKSFTKKNWIVLILGALMSGLAGGLINYYQRQLSQQKQKQQQQKEQKEFLQKHKLQIQNTDFIKESAIYQQIKEHISLQTNQFFKILSGCPGTGKTSAAKQLAAQINNKNDGKQAFYITMTQGKEKYQKKQKNSSSVASQKKLMQLDKLIYLIKKKYDQNKITNGEKNVKLFVDDFNKLWAAYMQDPKNDFRHDLVFDLYQLGKSEVIDPIYITSNSQCIFEQKDRSKNINASTFQKYAKIFILDQNNTHRKLKQLNWQILNRQLKKQIYNFQIINDKSYSQQQLKQLKQNQEVLNKILLYTPRRLNQLISNLKLSLNKKKSLKQNLSKQELQSLSKDFVQFVRQYQKSQMKQIKDSINEALTKVQNKAKFIKALLKIQKCHYDNRFDLSEQLGFNTRQIFDKLENSNVTIYGRPRSILQRKVLQDLLKQYSQAQKKDGQYKKWWQW